MKLTKILAALMLSITTLAFANPVAADVEPGTEKIWDVANADTSVRHSGSLRTLVFDLQELNGRMYVGGKFLDVEAPNGQRVSRPYLAAFDLETGEYISSFQPSLDMAVYAIAIADDGDLLVGGEVTGGIVKLDPVTGATDTSFQPRIDNSWGNPAVWDVEVSGGYVYAAGSFNRHPDGSVKNFAKFDSNGNRIMAWSPVADYDNGTPRLGSHLVFGIAIDESRDRVYAAGKFGGINGDNSAFNFAILDTSTGSLRTDVPQGLPLESGVLSHRTSYSMWQHDVQFRGDEVYIGGQAHQTLILDADTLLPEASFFTNQGVGDSYRGGDTQVLFVGETTLWAGCHCWGSVGPYELGSYNHAPNNVMHHSEYGRWVNDFRDTNPFGQQHARGAYGIDIATQTLVPTVFNLAGQAGAWAIYEDSNGRLWLGGQFLSDPVAGRSVNGLARFSPSDYVPSPNNLSVDGVSSTTIDLSWDNVDNATYNVYRDGVLLVSQSELTLTDTGLNAATEYSYQVSAVVGGIESALSIPVVATTDNTQSTPTPEGFSSSTQTTTSITLNWTGTPNTTYTLYRDGVNVGTTSDDFLVDINLTADTTYSYALSATVGNSESALTQPLVVSTLPEVVVPSPTNLTATAVGTTVSLTWDVNQNTTYTVSRDGVQIGSGNGGYEDSGLQNDTTYFYQVVASENGLTSNPAEVFATTEPLPTNVPTPEGFRTTYQSNSRIVLNYQLVSGATYNIYRDGVLHDTDTNGWHTDRDLTPGTTYTYQVSAVVAGEESALTAPISVSTTGIAPVGSPEGLRTTYQSHNRIVINWQDLSGVQYNIYVDGVLVGSDNDGWFTITGLNSGTSYQIGLTAITNGVESTPSVIIATTN